MRPTSDRASVHQSSAGQQARARARSYAVSQAEEGSRKTEVAPCDRNFVHGNPVQQVRHGLAQTESYKQNRQQHRPRFCGSQVENAQQGAAGEEKSAESEDDHRKPLGKIMPGNEPPGCEEQYGRRGSEVQVIVAVIKRNVVHLQGPIHGGIPRVRLCKKLRRRLDGEV